MTATAATTNATSPLRGIAATSIQNTAVPAGATLRAHVLGGSGGRSEGAGTDGCTLKAIKYDRGRQAGEDDGTTVPLPKLALLNQLLLPHHTVYEPVTTVREAWDAIKTMKVRGAPAIAIVAALALSCDLCRRFSAGDYLKSPSAVAEAVNASLDYLVTSRPTAVNLSDTAKKLSATVAAAVKREREDAGVEGGRRVVLALVKAAEQILENDLQDNLAIGENGARWILDHLKRPGGNVKVLTHCNTGSLATSGYGTALGIVRSLHSTGRLTHTYCSETRPYNQGSRLTSYELVHDKMPATLVCDSACASLLRRDGEIAAVVVGADRVASNGDTANKVGTYSLAVLAKTHGALFIVAAPVTSIDLNVASGDDIVVEERHPTEVTCVSGVLVACGEKDVDPAVDGRDAGTAGMIATIRVAAPGVNVWNPSFDITPAEYINAIVTERGVAEKPEGSAKFDLIAFLSTSHSKQLKD